MALKSSFFLSKVLMKIEVDPLEPRGASQEPDDLMVVGVSKQRLKLEVVGIPPEGGVVEGSMHMDALDVGWGPSHEAVVARLR